MSTPRSDADGTRPPIRLSDLGSGRLATRAFAVPTDPQRFRRPTDVVLLVVSLVILAITASAVDDPGDFERSLADWLSNLPGFLDFLWTITYDFVQIWVLVVGLCWHSPDADGGSCVTGPSASPSPPAGSCSSAGSSTVRYRRSPTASGPSTERADSRPSPSRRAPLRSPSRVRTSSVRCARSVGG